ncbi:type IV pilus secretin PilQ family protein [Lysobacter sp. TY2-98]|uniref:type IV pilus secretin PilQ n=1 Tax=Lysobacter sp. TY2-98 TaxID=2290922 RepID=UPI001F07C2F0|nr:type IV pilus secretin PilQ family protein [Lysobacter sp. TY2-98]
MTSNNAQSARTARPLIGARLAGLALGMLAALGSVQAAPPAPAAPVAPAPSLDPAKQLPGTVSVADIDFKRSEDGSGRLVVHFSGEGATPDLRKTGSNVIVDIGNAQLPANLRKTLDVSDFATPVTRIDPRNSGAGTQLVLDTSGSFDSMAYQTGRDYIVEISPKSATSSRAVGGTADVKAAAAQISAANASARYSGKPVTFNFQDVPVRTVLQLIAEESGLNIVAADTVQGNVTLRLINVPWDQALDIVLQAKGLDKRRNGNVVWIAPQAEIAKYEQDREDARIAIDNRTDLVTEYVQINYHNADAIFKALTEAKGIQSGGQGSGAGSSQTGDTGFLSSRGRLVADERTNTLMISDIPKKVAAMKELIRVIDRPVDQVVIEARVVIATDTFSRELGAKFGISGASGKTGDRSSLGFGGSAEASSENAKSRYNTLGTSEARTITRTLMTNLPVSNPAGAIGLSILNAGYLLDAELSALQTEGRGEVISNPRVVTSNQREAVITQGKEVGYVTLTPAAVGAVPTPNVQFKDVVLQMRVTPTITNDGRVFLNMAVKKDEVEGFIDTSIGQVPQISKREVNTAVLVEDGQTVVIGGVYEFTDRKDLTKVPFLADIPWLGNLFKKNGRTKDKAELLIFVTPKVLHVAQR